MILVVIIDDLQMQFYNNSDTDSKRRFKRLIEFMLLLLIIRNVASQHPLMAADFREH